MADQAFGTPAGVQANFLMGDVFNRCFSVFGRNFPLYFVITAILTVPNLYFQIKLAAAAVQSIPGPGGTPRLPSAEYWQALGGTVLCALILSTLAHAAVMFLAFRNMRGQPSSVQEAASHLGSRLLPLYGTLICVSFIGGAGMILLIIPGLMVLIMAYVAIPACIIEDLGPMASFWRSAELTKGYRWQVFAIALVVSLVIGIGNGIFSYIAGLALGGQIAAALDFPIVAILGAFGSVLVAAIYHDLRAAKEGLATDRIADVFT